MIWLWAVTVCVSWLTASEKRNVLFIAVDDLRCDLGCYGVEHVRSPNIDRLASSGVTFQRAYVHIAVCNPSRVAVMTGLRPDTTKVWDLPTEFRTTAPDAVTMPQYFRQHGYRALSFGKIFHNPWPDQVSWDEPHRWPEGARTWSESSMERLADYKQTMRRDGKSQTAIDRMRGPATDQVDVEDSQHSDGAIADQAIEAMRRLAEGQEPFFLAAGFIRPHLPLAVPRRYWELYDRVSIPLAKNPSLPKDAPPVAFGDRSQGGFYELRDYMDYANAPWPRDASLTEDQQRELKHGYYAAVSYVDAQIGRLLDELDRLDLADRTTVVLWSDHGWKLGEHNGWCKQTNYEIDTRAPLIIRSPGSRGNGTACRSLVEFIDIYPTLCETSGIPVPDCVQGKSQMPAIEDSTKAVKDFAISQFLREHEKRWYMGYALRTDRYRYIEWIERRTGNVAALELYDHQQDPDENVNIAQNTGSKDILESLKTKLWSTIPRPEPEQRPNVLMIAMDDLNDWIGCLGGHPQTRTPNLDRLAARGVLFTNAHCAAPSCNPSRTAVWTGRAPNRTGLYDNRQPMRELLPNATLLPQYFRNQGYSAIGSGKLLHYFIDAASWDHYFPDKEFEDPIPKTFYPSKRPVHLPLGGPWQYAETDWSPLDVSDETFGGDWSVTQFIGQQLAKQHDQPFFLGCGIYRPHEPWFVPKAYFEPFPIDEIQLPPGYRENDLDDLPEEGKRAGPNRYFEHIVQQGQWKQGVQSYLASIHFADAMLGRVLDALDQGPNRDNTIVMLWSDHGWQLGEKQHWQKFTLWRQCTRVPLMIAVPPRLANALPAGTPAGQRCDAAVNLLSVFPTAVQLCNLPRSNECDGPSLVPLLIANESPWQHPSITYGSTPSAYSVSDRSHRYIHYPGGDEELYDIAEDPYEWTNLAGDPRSDAILQRMRLLGPREFVDKQEPSPESLTKLEWHASGGEKLPDSKPDGDPFAIHFTNRHGTSIELLWMDRNGQPKSYGTIAPRGRKTIRTRPGAVWLIQEPETKTTLGYFVVGDRTAEAIIPE